MNEQNLIPFSQRSKSETRAIGTKGGRNSGKARLRKKRGRELMRALLELPEKDPKIIAQLEALGFNAKDMTNELSIHIRQIEKAKRTADTKAYNAVNKVAGYLEEAPASSTNVIVVRNAEEAVKLYNIKDLG